MLYTYDMTLYHGTQASLAAGDLLTPAGAAGNGHRDHLSPSWVFATEHLPLAREYAHGFGGGATRECYVYEVEAVGSLEQDPADVSGSYRSRQPLRVVRLAEVRRVERVELSSGYAPLRHGPWEKVA